MGGKKEGKFITRTTSDGKIVRIPVGTIKGEGDGPQITIYGGQHGTEYNGIVAVQRLYATLNPDDVHGTIVIGLATNEESLFNWIQFAKATPEIVSMMHELVQGSQYFVNCHGGEFSEGMCPYVICHQVGKEEIDREALEMAEAFGLPYISFSKYRGKPPQDLGERGAWWLWPKKGIADEFQIPGITPEVGQRGSRDENHLMLGGLINVLKHLKILNGESEPRKQKPKAIGERYWLTADEQGIFFPEIDVCEDVREGQRLGEVRDYFGNVLQELISPADAKVMNLNLGLPVRKGGFLVWLGEIVDLPT